MVKCSLCGRELLPSHLKEDILRGGGEILGGGSGFSNLLQGCTCPRCELVFCFNCRGPEACHYCGEVVQAATTTTYGRWTVKEAKFEGKTMDEAIKKAESAHLLKILEEKPSRAAKVTGKGDDEEAAFKAARKKVPKESPEEKGYRLVQKGEPFECQVDAFSEKEATDKVMGLLGQGDKLLRQECLRPPTRGFLGVGKKPGAWKASCFKPYVVEIEYEAPFFVKALVKV